MFKRLSAAIAAGRQAAAGPAAPSADAKAASRPATWALIHFGDARDLVPRLAAHRAFCLRRGVQCLLVSDDIPQLCVSTREVRFEFCPWPAHAALTTPGGYPAAVDHSFRRLGQILDFWQVVGCDWDGERAEALLRLAPEWAHPAIHAARRRGSGASQSVPAVLTLPRV